MTANAILIFSVIWIIVTSLPKIINNLCDSGKQTKLHIIARKMFFPLYYKHMISSVRSTPSICSYPLLVELELNKQEYKECFINNGYSAVVDRIMEFTGKFAEKVLDLSRVPTSLVYPCKPKNNSIQESINFMHKFREAENLGLTIEELEFMEKEGTSFNDN